MDINPYCHDDERTILSVSSLTEKLRKNLEARFPFVWVKGEVSNFSRASSGHIYFTLKDAEAQLQCVWFARRQRQGSAGSKFDPLTGEVFERPRPAPHTLIKNGIEIFCGGSISVYAGRGQYQLVVDIAQPGGAGLLAQAFEERKARLAKAGYFDQSRKMTLPLHPVRVALITSSHGAAIHDFMELSASRGLSSTMRLFPVPVQGDEASGRISAAIDQANAQNWAQVIVIIRGGGSLEDLWAFNEENVVEAIYRSKIPVLTGIGHEIDFSLADLAADVRAATPSHAAQLLWPMRRELWQKLDELQFSLFSLVEKKLNIFQVMLDQKQNTLVWHSPQKKLQRLEEKLNALEKTVHSTYIAMLNSRRHRWESLSSLLLPAKQLHALFQLRSGQLDWQQKSLEQKTETLLDSRQNHLLMLAGTLRQFPPKICSHLEARLKILDAMLAGLDPELPIRKGYALLYGKNGIVRSIADCNVGEKLGAKIGDGTLELIVYGKSDKPENTGNYSRIADSST